MSDPDAGSRPPPAFGLALGRRSGRYHTEWEQVPSGELDTAWSDEASQRLVEQRHPDGRLFLSVDHDERAGYLVDAPGYGRHLVGRDGTRITSELPDVPPWRWQRLLFSQVLPLAAVLQGLELFHASAVALGGRAIALVAASGTGKSSVAAHLVARGARPVTDDVLALEPGPDGITAYPGGALSSLDAAELDSIAPGQRARLGPIVGRSDKLHLVSPVVAGPLPLQALYFLRRISTEGAVEIEHDVPDAAAKLLGSAFLPHIRSPDRLINHLDTCAVLASSVPVFAVTIPTGTSAAAVADAVERHASVGPALTDTDRPAVREARRRFSRAEKARLLLEILSTYVRVRRSLRGRDVPQTLESLRSRAKVTGASSDVELEQVVGMRLAWATARTLRTLPTDSRCLMQALVLTSLLSNRGIDSSVVIGVAPGPDFEAHAWVESHGDALLPTRSFERLTEM